MLPLVGCDASKASGSPGSTGAVAAATASAGVLPSASPVQGGGGAPVQPGPVTFDTIPQVVAEVEPSVVTVFRDGGLGSGVVWNTNTIVTNNHVIVGVTDVEVAFADGSRSPGRVLAADPLSDLAVVRTERNDLPPATFADALPRVGTLAVAIGSPLGFENSATAGIVSGTGRSIPGAASTSPALVDLIQTDAPISPGNSGGALVGPDARVIGVNVAYIPPAAGSVSIGFAIPAPTVTDVVTQLLEDGTVDHSYLGTQTSPITPQVAQRFGLQGVSGVLVADVAPGSPAAAAGIRPGDVITAIGDERIESVEDLLTALRHHKPGEQVAVRLLRGGKETEVQVTLGKLPG